MTAQTQNTHPTHVEHPPHPLTSTACPKKPEPRTLPWMRSEARKTRWSCEWVWKEAERPRSMLFCREGGTGDGDLLRRRDGLCLRNRPGLCTASLIHASKRTHASPLVPKLHWLPIAPRTEHKVSSTCYDVVSKTAHPYSSTRFTRTSHPVHCIPQLTPALFGFQKERKSSKGNALFPIWALSHK